MYPYNDFYKYNFMVGLCIMIASFIVFLITKWDFVTKLLHAILRGYQKREL